MNFEKRQQEFLIAHLKERVQEEYDLSDEEMEKLLSFMSKFDEDPIVSLKRVRKKKNVSQLEDIIQNVLRKEVQQDAHKEYHREPSDQGRSFSPPTSFPLSFDHMIIQPYMYEGY